MRQTVMCAVAMQKLGDERQMEANLKADNDVRYPNQDGLGFWNAYHLGQKPSILATVADIESDATGGA